MLAPSIDINADVGEGCGFDAALMTSITSASVAAGFHAGSPEILQETIRLARAHGVAVGAHPGFRDREGFGRREIALAPSVAEALVYEQIAIVASAAAAQHVRLQHVKPHGALYNMAVRDRPLANAIVRAIAASDPTLILFAPPHSQLFAAGQSAGLRVASEVFADRAYSPDGALVPRGTSGAVIDNLDDVVARTIRMVKEGTAVAADGSVIELHADTICVHGDTRGCDLLARKLHTSLEKVASVRSVFSSL